MMDFLKDELAEAKLFRSPASFKTKNAEDIAHNIYAHILSLQAMRYTDPGVAGKYAKDTLRFSGFDGVRAGGTDLHNLIAGLERADDKGNLGIPAPTLKKFLRDIQNGVNVTDRDRRAIMSIEKSLGITDPNLKNMRRIISDWPRALPNEQKIGATRLGFMLNHYARGSDLHKPYLNSINGIAAQQAKSPYGTGTKTFAAMAAGAVAGYMAVRNPRIKQAAQVDVKKYYSKN